LAANRSALLKKLLTNENKFTHSNDDLCITQLKQYWFCRSLLLCQGAKILSKDNYHSGNPFQLIGFSEDELDDIKQSARYKEINARAKQFIETSITRQGDLFTNLQQINQHFGMSELETEIMLFATLLELDTDYGDCYDFLGQLSNRKFYSYLARILDIAEKSLIEAFSKQGLLFQSGLLKVDSSASHIDRKFGLLSGFCSALDSPQPNIESLFSSFITPAPAASLTPEHFTHIKKDYARLSAYLKTVCDKKICGANILIYGSPGTGKTQWVRTLTHELKIKLYEISVEDENGDILSGKERISACQMAQKLLEKGQLPCLLFDEIEDLFQMDSFSQLNARNRKNPHSSKGWINQLLENNAVPTFWLSNDISCIDEAFLRRFDLVFELPVPSHSVRKQMLTESLHGTPVSNEWINRLSHLEHLPPSVINRATRVNKIIGETQVDLIEEGLEEIIGNSLKAMGRPHKAVTHLPTGFYDPELINTKAPLAKIAAGLKRSGEGRLCFYGAPGTGKSAYAKYLSEYLEMPLIAKRASDIIDCYVGNTEKNIAQMFAQATQEKGLLLLDEADSFLRDRKNSQHSWETTLVNELLVQMENFKGIFICSTNLMDDLDAAALRRFDFKLEFTYLNAEQAWKLLKGFLANAINTLSTRKKGALKKQLSRLEYLTPGDFSAVKRKLSVMGEMDNVDLFIQELKSEVGFKNEGSQRSIGFTAQF